MPTDCMSDLVSISGCGVSCALQLLVHSSHQMRCMSCLPLYQVMETCGAIFLGGSVSSTISGGERVPHNKQCD